MGKTKTKNQKQQTPKTKDPKEKGKKTELKKSPSKNPDPKALGDGKYLTINGTMVTCCYSAVRGKKNQKDRQNTIAESKVSTLVGASKSIFDILKKAENSIELGAEEFELMYPQGQELRFADKDVSVEGEIDTSAITSYTWDDDEDDWDMGRKRKNKNKNKGWKGGGGSSSYNSSQSSTVPKFYIGVHDDNGHPELGNYVWSSTERKVRDALEEAGIEPDRNFSPKGYSTKYDLYMVDVAAWEKEKTTSYRSVQLCAFNATKKHIECMHGGSLAQVDENWYKDCPLCETGGVPLNFACTVINKLVEPYNFRIARVRVRKGMSTHKDAPSWMQVLGINPMAIHDHNISNDDFIEQMADGYKEENGENMPDKDFDELVSEVYKQFRFEYHDRPFPGSIVFYSTRAAGGSTPSYALGGGHSEFLAPRSPIPAKWQLSIILERKHKVEYDAEPPEIPEPEYNYVLDPWGCKVGEYTLKSYDKSSTEWDKRVAKQKKDGTYKEPKGGSSSSVPSKSQKSSGSQSATTNSSTSGTSGTTGSTRGSGPGSSSTSDETEGIIIRPKHGVLPDPKDFPHCPHGFARCDDKTYRHYRKIPSEVTPMTLPRGFEGGSWTKVKNKWIFTAGKPDPKWESQIPEGGSESSLSELTQTEIELIRRASIMEGASPEQIERRIRELEAGNTSYYSEKDRKQLIELLQKELAVRALPL